MLPETYPTWEMFPGYVADYEVPDDSENLFLSKMVFLKYSTKESLENLEVYLNTFPGCKQTNRLQTA